jgi:hypothetical protein
MQVILVLQDLDAYYSWQSYGSVLDLRRTYGSGSTGAVSGRIEREAVSSTQVAKLCFRTGRTMGEVTVAVDEGAAGQVVSIAS